ncbi:MAG: hypothetical protein MI919_32990 [Holophagales bacterium]|nr:hypothetical protein [Holophagales bacterium]
MAPELRRPTSLAWSRFEGELEVAGAELPWPGGERRHLRVALTNHSSARWLAGERLGGGMAVEVKLFVDGENLRAGDDWLGLPRDLEPGESHVFGLWLRRPLAAKVRLELIPHVLGFTRLSDLGGPRWAREL